MTTEAIDFVLKSFERPDDVRTFPKGRFETVHLRGQTFGRATYQPGWRWSVDFGPSVGAALCEVGHVGLVLEGTAAVGFDDGRVIELTAGSLFHVPPVPHDSWVIGTQRYVSLHFMGAERYARPAGERPGPSQER